MQSQGQGQQAEGEGQSRLALSLEEVSEIKDAQNQLEEDLEELKTQFKREYDIISQTLQEERYRCVFMYWSDLRSDKKRNSFC